MPNASKAAWRPLQGTTLEHYWTSLETRIRIQKIIFPGEHSSTALDGGGLTEAHPHSLPCGGSGFKDVPRMSKLMDYSFPAFPTH